MKWIILVLIIISFSGLFIGFTNWVWWLCICVSIAMVYGSLLVYMTLYNIIVNRNKRLLKEIGRHKQLEERLKRLLEEIKRHKQLEERLVEDVLSLIELYNYYMSNCYVSMPKGTTEKLHQAMADMNEYLKHRNMD